MIYQLLSNETCGFVYSTKSGTNGNMLDNVRYFWVNSRCRIGKSVEKTAVFLHPLYIIVLKIVPREWGILM